MPVAKDSLLNDPTFSKVMVVVVIGLIFVVVISNDYWDRFSVGGITRNATFKDFHPLVYKTEFCAGKLTGIVYESDYLSGDIKHQIETEGGIGVPNELVEDIVVLEQRELDIVHEEFEKYRAWCDAFDEQPSRELCDRFLGESGIQLAMTQKNYEAAKEGQLFDQVDRYSFALSKAQRVHQGLQKHCEGVHG